MDDTDDKMSCDYELENAGKQMKERKQELEEMKIFKGLTETAYDDISEFLK